MIILTSASVDPVYSPVEVDTLPSRDRFDNLQRRATRSATLDGSAVVFDNGFSHADRTFSFVVPEVDESTHTALRKLVETSSSHVLANREGAFRGVLGPLTMESGNLRCEFTVTAKLSA